MTFHPYWIVFAVSFLAVGEWESRVRRRPLLVPERRRWLTHSVLTFLGLVSGWTLFRITSVATAMLVADNPLGLLNRPWLPGPAAWFLTVLLLDLSRYAIHFAHHRIPWLWRLHQVHHSDPDLDLSTGLRAHPFESVLVQAVYLATVALLAPPVGAVILAECLFCFQAFFEHANAELPAAIESGLRRVFVTPNMHRIHHSERESEQGGNFGDLVPWWDFIFGTYIQSPIGGHAALTVGLPGLQNARSLDLWFLLRLPFQSRAEAPRVADAPGQ